MASEETIKAASDYLEATAPKWSSCGIAYGKWFADDTLGGCGEFVRGGCHGGMKVALYPSSYGYKTAYQGDGKGLVVANVTSSRRRSSTFSGKDDDKIVEAYFRYVVQESPLRVAILNRDNLKQCMDSGVIVDVENYGTAAAMLIVKLLRVFIEDTFRPRTWFSLVERGVHPMLALLVSQITNSGLRYNPRTHGSCLLFPVNEKQLANIFVDEIEKKPFTEAQRNNPNWEGTSVFGLTGTFSPQYDKYGRYTVVFPGKNFPLPPLDENRVEKVPDGWGGYVEKTISTNIDEYAAQLVELQKKFVK